MSGSGAVLRCAHFRGCIRATSTDPKPETNYVALKKLPLSLKRALAGCRLRTVWLHHSSPKQAGAGKVCDQTAHLAFVCHPLQQRRRSVLLEEFLFSLLKSCVWRELASLHHTKLRFQSRRVRLQRSCPLALSFQNRCGAPSAIRERSVLIQQTRLGGFTRFPRSFPHLHPRLRATSVNRLTLTFSLLQETGQINVPIPHSIPGRYTSLHWDLWPILPCIRTSR